MIWQYPIISKFEGENLSFKARKAYDCYFISWLLLIVCVFILHLTNINIKLIGYNEIPCFKYLNQAFLCSFLQFYKFYPIDFHFGGYFYSNQKMKMWFYPTDEILMGINTQMPSKLSVAPAYSTHILTYILTILAKTRHTNGHHKAILWLRLCLLISDKIHVSLKQLQNVRIFVLGKAVRMLVKSVF